MAIHGNLNEVAVVDLIRRICQRQITAHLLIQSKGKQASLFFKGGHIIHAVMGNMDGLVVIYAVLGWGEGNFRLEEGVEAPANSVNPTWSRLLLTGAGSQNRSKFVVKAIEDDQNTHTEATIMMKNELEDLLAGLQEEIDGFIAAAIIDMDGLSIAQHAKSSTTDVEAISAQIALFIKLVETTITKLQAGTVEDNLLSTDKAFLLIWCIKDTPYFLGIAVERQEVLLGHLRLVGRLYVDRLAKLLSLPERVIEGVAA